MRRGRAIPLAVAGFAVLALVAAAMVLTAFGRSGASSAHEPRAFVHQKDDPSRLAAGRNAETAVGANEQRGPDSTPDVEAYLQRAYPADEVTMDQTIAAQNGGASLAAGPSSRPARQSIGPSKPTYPAASNVPGSGTQYAAR